MSKPNGQKPSRRVYAVLNLRLCSEVNTLVFRKTKIITNTALFLLFNRSPHFASPPIIKGNWPLVYNAGFMSFGKRCVFRGGRFRLSLCTLGDGRLEIGDYGFINDGVNICATTSIKIGHNVKIGDMTTIYDSDFHQVSPDQPVKQKPVVIGNNVWIGANVMILAGSEIGDHSVIGAGSIVAGKIPPCSVCAGQPARQIKTIDVLENWVRG